MNISVPSRFACLKVEDDEPQGRKNSEIKKKTDKGPTVAPKSKAKGSQQKSVSNNNNTHVRKEKKQKQQQKKQWDDWKEKDDKLINGNFEQDLESAILLSKLHYEENKDKYDKVIDTSKKSDKKKKKNVMSLDQFLAPKETKEGEVIVKNPEPAGDFFEIVQNDAKKLLDKEQLKEQRKQRETAIEEIISNAQYQERLEIERKKNETLEAELFKAREEIANVKVRNQTLCTMLSTGEMKDKADVLLELERLNIIKNDLTDEVARLYALLEQERSKVAALTADSKHKDKHKHKKHAQ